MVGLLLKPSSEPREDPFEATNGWGATTVFVSPELQWHDEARAHLRRLLADLRERCRLAQPGDVGEGRLRAEDFLEPGLRLVAAQREVERLVAIEPHQVGDEADLRRCPVAVSAIHLSEDLAGVDQAKSDALMKDYNELAGMSGAAQIKAKAKEMLGKL